MLFISIAIVHARQTEKLYHSSRNKKREREKREKGQTLKRKRRLDGEVVGEKGETVGACASFSSRKAEPTSFSPTNVLACGWLGTNSNLRPAFINDGHVAFNQALVNHPSSPPITDKRPRSNGFIVVGVRPLSKINVRHGRSIWGFGMGRVEEIKWTEVTVDRHEIARRSLRLNHVDMWREVCCGGDNAREIEEIADD